MSISTTFSIPRLAALRNVPVSLALCKTPIGDSQHIKNDSDGRVKYLLPADAPFKPASTAHTSTPPHTTKHTVCAAVSIG